MKDIIWLDWARVIGIFLVVFGHVLQRIPLWEENTIIDIWNWIYLFHMPLFFVISGYLYTQNGCNRLNKIFWSLTIPYLIYQVLFIPLRFWLLKADNSLLLLISKQLCGILLGDGYNTPISTYSCLPCWFIVCIIQLRLLFMRIKINVLSSTILSIISLVFLYIRDYFGLDFYACIDCTLMAIPYFLLGFWLRETSSNTIINNLVGGKSKVLNCLIFGAIICLVYKHNGAAQMIGPSVGHDTMINYIGGCAGTLLVFNMSHSFIKIPTCIKTISRNTLFIIFFHWCCLFCIRKTMFVTINVLVHFVEAILLAILILIASYFAIKLCSKHCKIVLGKYMPN